MNPLCLDNNQNSNIKTTLKSILEILNEKGKILSVIFIKKRCLPTSTRIQTKKWKIDYSGGGISKIEF